MATGKRNARRATEAPIPTEIVASVERDPLSPAAVAREFERLLASGADFRSAGGSHQRSVSPKRFFKLGYGPKHKIELFGTGFYLSNVRQNPDLRFMVAYVVQAQRRTGRPQVFPRIFYKDLSLVWRSASHYSDDDGLWIGKGDTITTFEDGDEVETSLESTTDLPIEMQNAIEALLRFTKRPRGDGKIIGLTLRRAPGDRVHPYADFTAPRKRANALPANRVNGGRKIARFTRKNDPSSLRFTKGFEPDFRRGILDRARSRSRLYHGELERFRILSTNRKIQYIFIAGPRHVWIIPPQALTTELSSYGVRTIDVHADDDLFVPGYEYHYYEDDGELYSQIPPGFAGDVCEHDDAKADASPWLDELPVIQAFRRVVLKR